MYVPLFFTIGITSGVFFPIVFPRVVLPGVLYAFLLSIGIWLGANIEWSTLRELKHFICLPLLIIVGTLLGAALCAYLFLDLSVRDALAVASGMGFYTAASALITESGNAELGSIALFSNLLRELLVLVAASVLAVRFGKWAPIAAGGATSMDVTLPSIIRASGSKYALPSFVSGATQTLLAPLLVTFFINV